jgi:hypothetical protein
MNDREKQLEGLVKELAQVAHGTLMFAEGVAKVIETKPERYAAMEDIRELLRKTEQLIGPIEYKERK